MERDSGKTAMRVIVSVWVGVVLIGMFLTTPDAALAKDNPKILLVNSDLSVEKYRMSQESFKDAMASPSPITEVNLGDKQWENLANFEELIYDEDPEIIYCIGTKAYMVINKFAAKKDIVFSSVINWLRLPTTERTCGVSNELRPSMEIMLFRWIFPNIQKIGVLYSKKYTEEWFKNANTEAKEMGVELIAQMVSKKQSLSALKKLLPMVDAYWLISDPELMSDKNDLLKILQECETQRKLVFSYHETFAEFGATLIVSADDLTMGRQAAGIMKDVLSGNKPEEKVQFPAGTYTILDMKKVYAYGVEYSEDAISSINEVRNYSIKKDQ